MISNQQFKQLQNLHIKFIVLSDEVHFFMNLKIFGNTISKSRIVFDFKTKEITVFIIENVDESNFFDESIIDKIEKILKN